MDYNLVPEYLKGLKQWVCAERGSKVPMQAERYRPASCSDPATWTDFDTAIRAVNLGLYDYLGFVFNNNGLVGIDIDKGFDADGFISEMAVDIVRACESFTERSCSGRGVHIYVKGSLPYKGRKCDGAEIYREGRYFLLTCRTLVYTELKDNQAGIDYVADKYFHDAPAEGQDGAKQYHPAYYTPSHEPPQKGHISLKYAYPEVVQGGRNNALASLAGQLYSQGLGRDDVLKHLEECNAAACKPPLDPREVEHIADSIAKYSH